MGQFFIYIGLCPAILIAVVFTVYAIIRSMQGKTMPELTAQHLVMLVLLYVTLVMVFAMLAVTLIAWLVQNTQPLDH